MVSYVPFKLSYYQFKVSKCKWIITGLFFTGRIMVITTIMFNFLNAVPIIKLHVLHFNMIVSVGAILRYQTVSAKIKTYTFNMVEIRMPVIDYDDRHVNITSWFKYSKNNSVTLAYCSDILFRLNLKYVLYVL